MNALLRNFYTGNLIILFQRKVKMKLVCLMKWFPTGMPRHTWLLRRCEIEVPPDITFGKSTLYRNISSHRAGGRQILNQLSKGARRQKG